jgi:hypothetical protein
VAPHAERSNGHYNQWLLLGFSFPVQNASLFFFFFRKQRRNKMHPMNIRINDHVL